MNYFAACLLACVLPWLTACTQKPSAPQPQRARSLDPATTAARMAALQGAAIAGDQDAVRAQMDAMSDDMRRSMRIPDPARRIPAEPAREAAKTVAGVSSAAWVDTENLLVMVDGAGYRSNAMIGQICMQLEPLGDTLWVTVHLQNRRATTGEDLEIISRNCQLAAGERTFMGSQRQLNVVDPSVRAQQQANQAWARQAQARKVADGRANAEALRNIPEM